MSSFSLVLLFLLLFFIFGDLLCPLSCQCNAYKIVNCKISTNNYWSHQIITHYKLLYKNWISHLNFVVITPCVFISLPDAFLSLGTLATFKGNFSLANMSMDIHLFSAPVFNRALTSLSCTLMGNVVPVSLPNIMLKMCSMPLKTHSTKYSFGLYLHPVRLVEVLLDPVVVV